MGVSESTPNQEPPRILSLLESNDILETSKYWAELFSYDFSNINISNLQSHISNIYLEKPYNFHLLIKICGLRLQEIDQNQSNNLKQIKTIIILLRTTIPIIASSGCQISVFNQTINSKVKLGSFLTSYLIKLLHFSGFTLNSKCETWCQNSNDDLIFIPNRIYLIDLLILFKYVGIPLPEFDHSQLFNSVISTLTFYLNSTSRKSFSSMRKLLQSSILFLLLLKADFSLHTSQLYHILANDHTRKFTKEENTSFILPFIYSLLSVIAKDDSIIDTCGLPLIVHTLYICDQLPNIISISAIAAILSFPSSSIALNVPCVSFDSVTPLHRGSYADIVIEVVSRQKVRMLKPIVMVIVNVIPYSSNLSYGSAISVFKVLSASHAQQDHESVKLIVSAIHYTINRSIRENIPLVILVMKNSKLLQSIHLENENFEECEQLVSFVNNVNQELKQIGTTFQSSELEKFFNDPSCERFTLPVLRPPQIDYDLQNEINNQIQQMTVYYVKNQINVK